MREFILKHRPRRRVHAAVTFTAGLFVASFAPNVQAQQAIPGTPSALPGVPMSSSGEGTSFGAAALQQSQFPRAAVSDPTGLLGLQPAASPKSFTLEQALAKADQDNPDIGMAAERIVQSEAGVRRAWAALLPQVNAGVSYTHNCQAGGEDGIFCGDRTAQLSNPEALEQQATLFESLASILEIAAGAENDPAERERLQRQADDLNQSAAETRATEVKPVVVQPASVWVGNVTFALPIFNARSFPLLMNAYSGLDLATAARGQVRATLLYSVARTYFGAVTAQKLAAVAHEQLAQATRHKEATAARVETQTQPLLALKRAELDELRARQAVAASENTARTSIAALGLLLNVDEEFAIADPEATVKLPQGEPEELVARAVGTRPEVQAATLSLEMAHRQELDAWAQFFPTVNLVASARATSFTSGFVRDPINATLGIQAVLPLYDGGNRYAALKDAGSRIREETLRKRQLEDRVRAQVRGNLSDLQVRRDAVALAAQAVVVAREAKEQAEALFDSGVGTSLDVSDTNLALFAAENEYARAELDLRLSQVGLAFVTGDFPIR